MVNHRYCKQLRAGLQWKAILILAFIVVSVTVVGGWFYFNAARRAIRSDAQVLASHLSEALGLSARRALADGDRSIARKLVREFIQNRGVRFAALVGADGQVLGQAQRDAGTFSGMVNLPVTVSDTRQAGDDILAIARPVVLRDVPGQKNRLVGAVRLVVDTSGTTATVARIQHRMSTIGVTVVLCTLPLSYLLIWRTMVKPIRRLAGVARRLGRGEFDARSDIVGNDEIGELANAFDMMAGDVSAMRDELVATNESLEHTVADRTRELRDSLARLKTMADTDHLTGLANRRCFAALLERYFSEACRYGFDLTCCMCDLDHYKQLNDTLGHQVGDKLLLAAADVIRATLRSSDIAARYGGDEFVLLLPHTSVARGLAVAQRIRRELISPEFSSEGAGCVVTMSIGISSISADHPANADTLVAMADRALYLAKDLGKDQIVTFDRVRETAA